MAIVFTQADLDNLKEALVTGAMEIEVQGRKIKYRSQDEILSLIGQIEDQLAGSAVVEDSDFVVGGFDRRNEDDHEE